MTSTSMPSGNTTRPVRVAAIQMASVAADKAANLETAARLIREARADVAVLPELFATEFFATEKDTRFFDYAETLDGPTVTTMAGVARETSTVLVVPFFEYASGGTFHNSAAVISGDGTVLGVYRKTHIPYSLTHEKYYFTPGNEFSVFDTPVGRLGVLICYDRWYPEAWAQLREAGAEIVCIPVASWRFGSASEEAIWDAMHRMRARENLLFVAAANRTGNDGEFAYIGASMLVAPDGSVLAQASETFSGVVAADIDLQDVRRTRSRWHLLRDRRPDIY